MRKYMILPLLFFLLYGCAEDLSDFIINELVEQGKWGSYTSLYDKIHDWQKRERKSVV